MPLFLLFAAAAVAAVAQQPAAAPKAKSAFDKVALEAYVRHLMLYPQQVTVTVGDPKPSEVAGFQEIAVRASAGVASEEKIFLVSKDGRKILQASVYDINENPFQKDLDRLKTDLQPSMGTPGAPVVLAVFSDFQCTYCKQEAQALRTELLKAFPTEVRLYFKDFPIAQIHPWARPAALAGRCIFRAKATLFWEYHDWIFNEQTAVTPENFTAKLGEFAKLKQLDAAQIQACVASKSAEADIDRSVAEARALAITSTPTIFINGRRIPGYIPWENLKQIIEFEIGYQKTAHNAGEQCCSLPATSLLPK